MAKELPFFKFEPSEYMFGRIQKQSYEIQGVFINICCKYWHKLGDYDLESLLLDFDKEIVEKLIRDKIITDGEDGNINIDFLDYQLNECHIVSKKNSESGKKSAQKRSTGVQRAFNDGSTEENREDKKREDKKKKELSCLDFFLQSSIEQETAIKGAKAYGIFLNSEQLKIEAEKHDAIFNLQFPNADIRKWQQYFGYYFEKMKNNSKGQQQNPSTQIYTPLQRKRR